MDDSPFEETCGLSGLASPHRMPWELDDLTSPGSTSMVRSGGVFDPACPDPLQGGMKSPISGRSPATSLHSGCPPIFKNSPNRNGLHPGIAAAGISSMPGLLFSNPLGSTILSPLSRASRGDLPPPGSFQAGVPLEFATTEALNLDPPSRRVLQFHGGASNHSLGAPASASKTNRVLPNHLARGFRTLTSGFAAGNQATLMIETSYTQPMPVTPRDLLQLPPALMLDSKPPASPPQLKRFARRNTTRPCAKSMGSVRDLPPTRLRRQTARAAALIETQNNDNKQGAGSPASSRSAGGAVHATCRRSDTKRAGMVASCSESTIVPLQTPGEARSNASPSSVAGLNALRPTNKCRCKKSKCLKLYCDCFAAGNFCNGCGCHSCANLQEHSDQVQVARDSILMRNPHAFQPKICKDSPSGAPGSVHRSGCNCKKSHCKKKYCECFQAGAPCGQTCKCENCHNQPTVDHPVQQLPQNIASLVEVPMCQSANVRRRSRPVAFNFPGTPSMRGPIDGAQGAATAPSSTTTSDTYDSIMSGKVVVLRSCLARGAHAAFTAVPATGRVKKGSSAAIVVHEIAKSSRLELHSSTADASAVAAGIIGMDLETDLSQRKPTPRASLHSDSAAPSPLLIDYTAMRADMQGSVLQLQPDTNIETTDQGRIVHTNRGPMMLVPLTTEGPLALSSSVPASNTYTSSSTIAHGNLHVQWKQTDDGCMVAIPLSSDQVAQQQQELAAEGSSLENNLRSTPQNDGSIDSSGPLTFQTLNGMLVPRRQLAAAANLHGAKSIEKVVMLSPQCMHHQQRNSALCFSPVLLTRGATRNLMEGPLDVPIAGSCKLEDEALEEQLQGLAEMCMGAEDQMSRQMLDPFEAYDTSTRVPESLGPGGDYGAPFGMPAWPTTVRTATTLVTDDVTDDTNYCQHSSKAKTPATCLPSSMTPFNHAEDAAPPSENIGERLPTHKRKGGMCNPTLPLRSGSNASTRTRLA